MVGGDGGLTSDSGALMICVPHGVCVVISRRPYPSPDTSFVVSLPLGVGIWLGAVCVCVFVHVCSQAAQKSTISHLPVEKRAKKHFIH